jgi:hypothetical protein
MDTCISVSSPSESSEDLPIPLPRWSQGKAHRWYANLPWLVGCNYIPATASNQFEMWQPDTFDPQRIDLELGWAEHLGMNVMRVFLHDLLWKQDAQGFARRIEEYLGIAGNRGIRTLFVLFDSCWHPSPHLGVQSEPISGVHNSRWVQSPGKEALSNPQAYLRLERYVTELLNRFGDDPRILGWDLWNEPDNENTASYSHLEAANKIALVALLLPQVFRWARSADPSQPLTSGLWIGDWSTLKSLTPIQRTQIQESDVISFHNYEGAVEFEKRIAWLADYGRPLLCTEYMARSCGSTFQDILPIAKARNVAAMNWGFVAGKTQTYLPWDSWQNPYVDSDPELWFHEILRTNGLPYRTKEVEAIRQATKPAVKAMAAAARH